MSFSSAALAGLPDMDIDLQNCVFVSVSRHSRCDIDAGVWWRMFFMTERQASIAIVTNSCAVDVKVKLHHDPSSR